MTQPLELLHPSLSSDSVLYISGPMTGHENFNYPFFNAIALTLRKQGLNILSPAEIDGGTQVSEGVDYTDEKPYSYYLKKAMLMMCNSDGIIMLEGWTTSKGARRELDFMLDCGMPAFRLELQTHYEPGAGVFGRKGVWLVPLDAGLEYDA